MAYTRPDRITFIRSAIRLALHHPDWGKAALPEPDAVAIQHFLTNAGRGLEPDDLLYDLVQDLEELFRRATAS